MICPRRRNNLRGNSVKVVDCIAETMIEKIRPLEARAPNCYFCGIALPEMLDLCLRINGFDQKYLCTQCGYYIEDNRRSPSPISPQLQKEVEPPPATVLLNIQHNRSETKDNLSRVKCRLCPETFESISIRNHHQKTNHTNPLTGAFKCPFCELEMKQITNLQVHVMRHTGVLPATCEVCGKGFAHAAFLQKHMRSHCVHREFICSICDKGFKYKHGLVQHQLLHTNERPFACDECSKTYRDLSDLRRHKYLHGGVEKRFKCIICYKQFFENKWLRQHMRIHEKTMG